MYKRTVVHNLAVSLSRHLIDKGFSNASIFSPMRTLDIVTTRYMKVSSVVIKYLLGNKILDKRDVSIESIPYPGKSWGSINRVWLRNAIGEWLKNNQILLVLLYNTTP
jgi:hypothetical protein